MNMYACICKCNVLLSMAGSDMKTLFSAEGGKKRNTNLNDHRGKPLLPKCKMRRVRDTIQYLGIILPKILTSALNLSLIHI